MAASRLKAVSARDGIPADVERRLADYLRQASTDDSERADAMGLAAQVLATSRADSPALLEIIDALTVALERQSLPVPSRESAQALFMIAHHTSLPSATLTRIEDRAFHDADRKVRIAAMRALIKSDPDHETKQRLHRVLMEQARLGDNEFATPESWNYDIGGDHNAITMLVWPRAISFGTCTSASPASIIQFAFQIRPATSMRCSPTKISAVAFPSR